MKRILGLDLGTNSIGWAVAEESEKETSLFGGEQSTAEATTTKIIGAGSRIIPMDAATLGDYEKGNLQSAASERTGFRGTRRLYERSALRRERLLRVLGVMGFLPPHYRDAVDFDEHPGKFKDHGEPLLAYAPGADGKKEFIFTTSFREMLSDFRERHPELLEGGKLVPYDWTIYYLRKKALTRPVTREKLAWILLNFNTKRGYYQLRGEGSSEDEDKTGVTVEYAVLRVANVEKQDANKKRPGSWWYEITYENGATQRYSSPSAPRQVGDLVEVIVTTTLDKTGAVKSVKLRTPKEEDWTLMKKRTECAIDASGGTLGEYIYDSLLSKPDVKVRGKLIHTIDRRYYRVELTRILDKQREFIPELNDDALFSRCVRELYRTNAAHAASLAGKGFTSLLVDDIIFYQRPLKSKKSLISDCPFEVRHWLDRSTGELHDAPLKCVSRSHPLFQEFRLWQFVNNLRIHKRGTSVVGGKTVVDADCTSMFLPDRESRATLFDWLNERKEVTQDQLLKYKPFSLGKSASGYRWNYVEDRTYPCNETLGEINRRLDKAGAPHLDTESVRQLWTLAISVTDPIQSAKALASFAESRGLDVEPFVKAFKSWAPETSGYCAYSEKALKRLLPLMRMGSHWDEKAIDPKTMEKIVNIIDGVADESIPQRVREIAEREGLRSVGDFCGLPVWLASYIVYGRHSEASDLSRWEKPEDIDTYLRTVLRHGSLRNPVVEKVVAETLKVARDIWTTYGKIDEVHVEMGRDLKNNADKRRQMSEKNAENERTNFRIRLLLQEFADESYGIADVRPHSPIQQELLKIYENEALNGGDLPDDIRTLINDLGNASKASKVTGAQINKYKLWLEQRYKSPYTGQTIPLSRLFTTEYQIEHVIPRSRYFDDSMSNKVICESEVNREKGNMLAHEFIAKKGGSIITVWQGGVSRSVKVMDTEQYASFVASHYSKDRTKMKKLMMDDVPDAFIERQLNDTRYMSRKIQEVLSMLVREEGEQEAISKHLVSTGGAITDRLKKDWGLNDVWNDLITPRFERLNRMTGTSDYGEWVNRDGKRYFQTSAPLSVNARLNKKRIDHRHHAMDAMVIACTTRSMVNFLNNQSALSANQKGREDLRRLLCYKRRTDSHGDYVWTFRKPCATFTEDARRLLEGIIVSFKQNLRVINKMTNVYTHFDSDGKRVRSRQSKGDGWAIRKSLHKATYSGLVSLQLRLNVSLKEALTDWETICDRSVRSGVRKVVASYGGRADSKTLLKYFKARGYKLDGKDISKVDVWRYTGGKDAMTASRVTVDASFDEKNIDKITDSGIRKIMKAHLHRYDDEKGGTHPEIAFNPEGVATMNRDIRSLNGGRDHKPILKVRTAETKGMKFPVGERGTKGKKFVEADKGTNLFFAVYADGKGGRSFESVAFNAAVESMKKGLPVAPLTNAQGERLLFTLSPNDLVYLPASDDENEEIQVNRIYKMVSCSQKSCQFVPANCATVIVNGFELESHNKLEISIDKINIKQKCIKLKVDRLGRITQIIK